MLQGSPGGWGPEEAAAQEGCTLEGRLSSAKGTRQAQWRPGGHLILWLCPWPPWSVEESKRGPRWSTKGETRGRAAVIACFSVHFSCLPGI